MDREKWMAEVTDTFAGEANYSWVRRYSISVPAGASNVAVMRAAKAAAGYSGVRGRRYDHGDTLEFRPARQCVVMFVSFVERVAVRGNRDFGMGAAAVQS